MYRGSIRGGIVGVSWGYRGSIVRYRVWWSIVGVSWGYRRGIVGVSWEYRGGSGSIVGVS